MYFGVIPMLSRLQNLQKITFDPPISIKSQNIDIVTNKFKLHSSGTIPSMSLGPTTPTAYNSGNGFFVDGNGKFLVGSGSGDRIQFDGTNFVVEAGNFSLDSSGNVTANGTSHQFGGTITANVINATGSGIIGAWNIGASAIESNTSAFRGTKIVSGSGIEGFGPTRHSKSSTTGLFNFGVAAAPGASTGNFDQAFDSPK